MKVIDLFCGMGGMAHGFAAGFDLHGYDINPHSKDIFRLNAIGRATTADLGTAEIARPPGLLVLTGGPPCRPWSALNRSESRLAEHDAYKYLQRFFHYIKELSPDVFLMENVVQIARDKQVEYLKSQLYHKYSMRAAKVSYANFGAATDRRRYFLVGFNFRHGNNLGKEFFRQLKERESKPQTVWDAIGYLSTASNGTVQDHEWTERSISEQDWVRIRSGKFGYGQLEADKQSPSFGNISKVHLLHPLAGKDGFPLRSISVKEAMNIMGFPKEFMLPAMGTTSKYQMVADSVSPLFSIAAARAIMNILGRG